MTALLAAALPTVLLAVSAQADDGLVAYWPLDEGDGAVAHDAVGDADGAVHGATWARTGNAYALQFDGVDDYVEFGDPAVLSPSEAVTVEAWVRPERIPGGGEPGIVGKAYSNYVLTYYGDGKCWWYTGQSGTNVKAPVSPGRWHHVVGTYDGVRLTLYVDGRMADQNSAQRGDVPSGTPFYMGKSDGDLQFTQNAHFAGMIAEVRIYNRALTAAEVEDHYHTTHLVAMPDLLAFVHHAARELRVELGFRALGPLPDGAVAFIEARLDGRGDPVATSRISLPRGESMIEEGLRSASFAPGNYQITAQVRNADGDPVGMPAETWVVWPAPPSWGVDDPRIKVLNSLVSELRNVNDLATGETAVDFTNPRDGWVFFRVTSDVERGGEVRIALPEAPGADSEVTQTETGPREKEAMRRLPAGRHVLTVRCSGDAAVRNVVIRAIPEIGYCRVDCGPQIAAYGPCDWEFLKTHILPNINLAVSRGAPSERALWEDWRRQGKRWIVETPLVGLGESDGVSADEVEKGWTESGSLDEPLLDGVIVDEFFAGDDPIWDSWHEALRRIRDNPDYAGKVFYPYCTPLYGAKASRAFTQTVMDAGWAAALERYLPEAPTEAAARAAIDAAVVAPVREWEAVQPGIVRHLLIVWGFFISAPNETTNIDPSVDMKAFTDMQMGLLANDPTFFGLYGVTSYLSAYSDEEMIRWYGRLCRHYCIEGRTDRLTDYYSVRHIENPDFADGLTGWTVAAAGEGAVATGTAEGLSWLEGRYPPTTMGNTHLLLRRSAKGPNAVRQTVRGLTPGALYSAKMISGDRQELERGSSTRADHAVRLEVDGVDLVPEKSFQSAFGSCYAHVLRDFNADNPYYMNLHTVTFRARTEEAVLSISDWVAQGAPGGPIGQELMCNFIEVQPALE